MEIGLIPEIKTYPGGLGVLAGDTIRSAADLNIPLIAITLISRMGNFRQKLTPEGRQIQYPVRKYHSNEAHAALLGLEPPQRFKGEVQAVRQRCASLDLDTSFFPATLRPILSRFDQRAGACGSRDDT
ncbi:MAG TPA: hypothetical protein DCR97_14940 [Deltaproteobacteria bacterium]|nr:hypothetical protein [Deltaproteobacteria bacterium]